MRDGVYHVGDSKEEEVTIVAAVLKVGDRISGVVRLRKWG